ncbi:enoyl-CoA hydratase-related protein [Roseococcus sp. DSY-14]|uniref:enoyl-CoA hydratase-related protein n=1 Tax=Roseococcus sp. DSY-14 TaxID=3369650 RepID=UPI00387B4235
MIRATRGPDGVALLVLDRPAARNALSLAMLEALRDALREAEDARCVVLAAEGPAFCAGHDLREMTAARDDADGGRALFARTLALCAEVMQAVVNHPVPVIAAVEGIATAAGCQLAASCDVVLAAPSAGFCTPGVAIGLFCSTPSVALTRAVGRRAAMEMLLTGRVVPAAEAVQMGLATRLEAEPRAAALAMAAGIAARSGRAIRLGKRAVLDHADCDLPEAYRRASAAMEENLLAADAGEGIAAFLARREPHWTDR